MILFVLMPKRKKVLVKTLYSTTNIKQKIYIERERERRTNRQRREAKRHTGKERERLRHVMIS